MNSLKLWRTLAALTPEGRSILDVGAYHGEFSVAARGENRSSPIYAFEPNPESLPVLRTESEKHNFVVIDKALSDKSSVLHFRCDSQRSSLSEENAGESIEVEAVSLDDWVSEQRVSPFLIKIDVEDGAAAVLAGSTRIMNELQPLILCEILSDEIGSRAAEILPEFYSYYHVNENHGLESKTVIRRLDWRYKNWFFVPREQVDLIPQNLIASI
jgi:FkbM family methyltransferase